MKRLTIILAIAALALATGCKKLPEFTQGSSSGGGTTDITVTTIEMTYVGATDASCRGRIQYNGDVTLSGFCWSSEKENPTLHDAYTIYGYTGIMDCKIYPLTPHTTYCIRAFATIDSEIYYGNVLVFETPYDYANPTVMTLDATDVTATTAILHGMAECPPGETYYGRFMYGTDISQGTGYISMDVELPEGGGEFSKTISGLQPNTTYQFKAGSFANGYTTAFGEVLTFTTLDDGGSNETPEGAINGLFSVSETKQVYFSKGSLQYQASTNTWRFAEPQYSIIGPGNSYMSQTYSGWIDLLGFATSGYDHGSVCYQPWSTSTNNSDYYAYGSSTYNLYDLTGKADWGYNAISNGGNVENFWRTLKNEEWVYLIETRSTLYGIRYAKAKINNTNGLILLPDNWDNTTYELNSTNVGYVPFDSNIISVNDWVNILEANGAVFLPGAGWRGGTGVDNNGVLYYWSSTYSNDNCGYDIYITDGEIVVDDPTGDRMEGRIVRLVHDAE